MLNNWFTITTGVITILSFLLQFKGVFPKHTELKKVVLYWSLGAFVGSFLGSINGANINISLDGSPLYYVVIVAQIAFFLSGLYFMFVGRVGPIHGEGPAAACIGIFLLLTFGQLLAAGLPSLKEKDKLTLQETFKIARYNEDIQAYDRALSFYRKAVALTPEESEARRKVEASIEECLTKSSTLE